MSLFELNDIKRDRIPYGASTYFHHRPFWAPAVNNNPILNLKYTSICAITGALLVEPINHFVSSWKTLNTVYELPRNSTQMSIYIKETFKTPFFWSELRKKVVYGAVQHSLDAGFKISCLYYIFGSTWSPKTFVDYNSLKYISFAFISAAASGWTTYPLDVARDAYYADRSWPAELRKGYRSPLHALLKIPFTEGPLYLFRGGFPIYLCNFFGMGWLFFTYIWLRDKFSFLWRYHEINETFFKFCVINASFAIGSLGLSPYLTVNRLYQSAPKDRSGKPVFKTSYEAAKYVKYRFSEYPSNLYIGYGNWFRQHGAVLWITIWLADSMGLMTNMREDPWSWRVSYGYYSD